MRITDFVRTISLLVACLLLPLVSSVPVQADGALYKFSMSYVYFGQSNLYASKVEATKNSLDEVSPNYFDLNEDGSLKLTPAVDTGFVSEMHKKGIKVVPFLSNHWNRELGRKALENREELAAQIASAVYAYKLDGVNVDIENLTEEDRENYVDFVKLLRQRLGSGKTIAVAVAPNPKGVTKGWAGSYDYTTLAKYADYLMVMTYDQSYQGGPSGPVASASFVEDSIRYAVKMAPAEKIVLGLPFYGRYWKNGETYGGYGISLTDVEKLIAKYRGKTYYDWNAQSARAVITIKASDEKPYLFGKKLEAGTYTIWYENESSLKYKLKLVQKYNLKGAGSWSLGQETTKTWDYYKLWLNGCYFADAQGHWARDHILSMALRGWMNGVSSSSFLPENTLTRAEAAAVLVRAFNLPVTSEGPTFNDISGHWAEKYIITAARHGIILGRGDGSFGPDRPVTRQELAVMLDRVLQGLKMPENYKNPYQDVSRSKNSWSYDSIVKMTAYGIFTGRPDGLFYPNATAKRAEMAALMDRIAN